MKLFILENLHHLLSCNVIGDIQYNNRYIGFDGELHFHNWFSANRDINNLYHGGYLIPPLEDSGTLDNPVYITISPSCINETYNEIFHHMSKISPKLFYIHFDTSEKIDKWATVDVMSTGSQLPVPKMHVYKFDAANSQFLDSTLEDLLTNFAKKPVTRSNSSRITAEIKKKNIERLENHTINDLLNLYVDRLIFDGYIGLSRFRGIPSDIDAIAKKSGKELRLIEIKEKDKSKRPPVGFGMDCRRINSLLEIQNKTGIPYFYVVREVHDQSTRKFKGWKVISMSKFSKSVGSNKIIEGGTGMRSKNSKNPTKVSDYNNFNDLK